MSEHPAAAVLESFLAGALAAAERRRVVAHLLAGCDACRAKLRPALAGAEPPEAPLPSEELACYDAPIERALQSVLLHGPLAAERKRKARVILDRLVAQGLDRVQGHRYDPFALFEALLAYCRHVRHEDPEQMLTAAFAALVRARSLGRQVPAEQAADLKARALGEVGNAQRVADRLGQAEMYLEKAEAYARVGTGALDVRLRLLDLLASLRGTQHRYGEAVALLDEIEDFQRRRGDRHGAGRALISKGVYVGYSGEAERALELFARGQELLDEAREPELRRLALHNRAYLLVDLGRLHEALALLEEHRATLLEGGALDRAKLCLVEGRIFAGFGALDLAESSFRAGKEAFSDLGAFLHAALLGLDLAAVVMRLGRPVEAYRLAVEAYDAFTKSRIRDHQAEAVWLLGQAVAAGVLTAELVERVAAFVRRAEHDPRARFDLGEPGRA